MLWHLWQMQGPEHYPQGSGSGIQSGPRSPTGNVCPQVMLTQVVHNPHVERTVAWAPQSMVSKTLARQRHSRRPTSWPRPLGPGLRGGCNLVTWKQTFRTGDCIYQPGSQASLEKLLHLCQLWATAIPYHPNGLLVSSCGLPGL